MQSQEVAQVLIPTFTFSLIQSIQRRKFRVILNPIYGLSDCFCHNSWLTLAEEQGDNLLSFHCPEKSWLDMADGVLHTLNFPLRVICANPPQDIGHVIQSLFDIERF